MCFDRSYGGQATVPMTQPTTSVTELLTVATEATALSERYQRHYDGAQDNHGHEHAVKCAVEPPSDLLEHPVPVWGTTVDTRRFHLRLL